MITKMIQDSLGRTQAMLSALSTDKSLLADIEAAISMTTATLQAGNKLLFAGNGGSAADAQHMAAEYVARFMKERPALAAIALTTDTSALTAIGNDYGFDHLFARQLQAIGASGDLLFAYSTSGTSANILAALKVAKDKGIKTIGLTGNRPQSAAMTDLCDITLKMPSADTPQIQEGHLIVGHLICAATEQQLFGP